MGYPYDKTYLEQIQASKHEKEAIRNAFYVLRNKYIADHSDVDDISLSLKEEFTLLGEAFELESITLDVPDVYHFMWDVLDELLPRSKDNE